MPKNKIQAFNKQDIIFSTNEKVRVSAWKFEIYPDTWIKIGTRRNYVTLLVGSLSDLKSLFEAIKEVYCDVSGYNKNMKRMSAIIDEIDECYRLTALEEKMNDVFSKKE